MIALLVLKILGFIFMAAGTLLVYGARFIAARYKIADKVECSFEDQLSEEELIRYKEDKALLSIKLKGMAVLASGIIIILIAFR